MASNPVLVMNANLTLYTGPARAGKTQLLCERVAKVLQGHPLARVVVIVPSAFLGDEFRHRLLKGSVRSVLGVEIVTLPDLCRSILGSAGLPYLEIGDIVQHQLLGTVVENLLADDVLRYYVPIALKPGFTNVVRDFTAELKHGLIRPSKFAAVATARGNKDKDLAAIYGAYHQLLQEKRLADQEGIMWLARDELAGDPQLGTPIDLLVIDDLEEPSPLQLDLIALLSARSGTTATALTYEEGRSSLDRGKRAFLALAEALQPDVVPVAAGVVDPHSPLGYLERHLFELDPVDQIDGRKTVTVLEAPERHREVKEVAREVKRLLLQGVPSAEITVLFRSLEPYTSVIHQVFEEFGIPVLVRGGRSLGDNPLVASLLRLLMLASDDFPRRGVIATLRSPYFDFTPFGLAAREVSALDRISRERIVTSGRSMWREALELEAEKPTVTEESGGPAPGPDEGVDPLQVLKNPDALFDAVTPAPEGTCQEYAAFVEELIGDDPRRPAGPETGPGEQESSGLRIVERVLAGPLELAVRDLSALQEVKVGLRSMTQTAGLTANGTGSWSQFLSDFRNVLNASRYTLRQIPAGRVVAQEVHQARGLTYRYAFLVGLSEGEFPRSTPVDILYDEGEREELRAAGLRVELGPRLDEPYLFYQAITRVTERLYLSYHYLDDEGRDLPPSPYLREITRLLKLDPPARVRLGSSTGLHGVASDTEFCIAEAEALEENDRLGLRAHNALTALPAWNAVLKGRELETTRLSSGIFGPFDGVLGSQDILATLQTQYGETHLWSPSSLSEYGTCPFKFLAHRLLGLEEPKEPEVGLDALQLGSIYHTILERVYATLIDRGLAVGLDSLGEVLEIAREVGAHVLESAPLQEGFRPSALWELERGEILTKVERLLAAEANYNGKAVWYSFGTLLANASALVLQVDPGELKVGVRAVRRAPQRIHGEVFLYDDVPGGAGYARAIRENLDEILQKASELGGSCTNPDCPGACYHCMYDYRNQMVHPSLNRELGTAVLDFLLHGKLPSLAASRADRCAEMLVEYARANWTTGAATTAGTTRFSRVFQDPTGQKVGLWVIHPLQARPTAAVKANVLAQSGIRCAVHTSFDLERRPFWVMNNLIA